MPRTFKIAAIAALSGVGKLDPFSPEFQSLTTNKGAMILGMLRWVIGDQLFDNTVRVFAITHADWQRSHATILPTGSRAS